MNNHDNLNKYETIVKQRIIFQARLLEAVNDSIVVAELNGKISYWNKGSERLFGWTAEEIIGQPFSIFFEETNLQDIPTHVNEIHRGFWEGKVPILTKSKERKYVRVSVTAMYDELNKPMYLVGVFSDITELIESRVEAEEALRSKGEFLANVSHEIRTPMTGILGYVELLGNLPMDDRQKQYLKAIKENANQLLDLINDILDLSKIEADKLLLEENKFNIQDLLNNVVKIFEPTINNKELKLVVDIASDLPPEIISDNVRIKQILSNLVSNAVKFTQQGEITISAYQGKMISDSKFELKIEVIDTGIGIHPDKIPLVFEPFVQADSSTTRKFGGTGLGLAICKKLVDMLEGEIKVESEVGKGSKFMFSIPVWEASSTSQGDLYLAKSDHENAYKLLLISPSENLFNQMTVALTNSDLELIWAKSSQRIPSIISFYEPDIVVIDLLNQYIDEQLQLTQLEFPPLTRLYYLCNNYQKFSELPINNDKTVKYIESLTSLIGDLDSFSITKHSSMPTTSANILIIDENPLSLMLINNILSNQDYTVRSISNITELSTIKIKNYFEIILLDIGIINKYGDELFDLLQKLNYVALIGIVNKSDTLKNEYFTDILYKPVTTGEILSVVEKYARGEDN